MAFGIEAVATAEAGEYENEYIITMGMTEDGTKVIYQYDFIDSQKMIEWIARMGDWAKETWENKQTL